MEENNNNALSNSDIALIIHMNTSFGELRQSKKQPNRLEALKYSVINDIEKIVKNAEIKLPLHKWNLELRFLNQDSNTIDLIKKVSKEFAFIESDGEVSKVGLSNFDADTLIQILNHLEEYALEKYLNYPECCIEFFWTGGSRFVHGVNWGGFIPCLQHKDLSLEEITELLGRNPTNEGEERHLLLREPEPEEIHSEKYRKFIVEV